MCVCAASFLLFLIIFHSLCRLEPLHLAFILKKQRRTSCLAGPALKSWSRSCATVDSVTFGDSQSLDRNLFVNHTFCFFQHYLRFFFFFLHERFEKAQLKSPTASARAYTPHTHTLLFSEGNLTKGRLHGSHVCKYPPHTHTHVFRMYCKHTNVQIFVLILMYIVLFNKMPVDNQIHLVSVVSERKRFSFTSTTSVQITWRIVNSNRVTLKRRKHGSSALYFDCLLP